MPNAYTPGERPHLNAVTDASPLMRFTDEDDTPIAATSRPALWPQILKWGAALGVALVIAAVVAGIASRRPPSPAALAVRPALAEGKLMVSAQPEGAQVLIDGVASGTTPLTLALPVGDHLVELRNGQARRSLPVTIDAAVVASHHVDLAPTASVESGRLDVTSSPTGARVTVDGTVRGTTPLTVADLAPGTHRVVISSQDVRANRTVNIVAGAVARVGATLVPAAPDADGVGWVVISSPIDLRVLTAGRFIGTTGGAQLTLAPGHHQLELVQPSLGYQSTVEVDVTAERVTTATVTLPMGTLSVNALPWAEVSIDGRPVGTTPLANIALPIGTHEIVLRHPQLGERRQSVSVTAGSPVRVGIDFSK